MSSQFMISSHFGRFYMTHLFSTSCHCLYLVCLFLLCNSATTIQNTENKHG